jgi:mono/diheme cytochrome c family protein
VKTRSLALALLVCGAFSACTCDDIDPMRRQPKYKAFQSNGFFSDDRAMRTPPEFTVPRERVRGSTELTEGGTDVAPAKEIPIPVTRELLQLGRGRFEVYCAACHGLLGDGESIVGHNMGLRPPPSLLVPPLSERAPGSYYRTITYGFGLMAPYATELDNRERWAVVAYLRALQRSQNANVSDVPADKRLELESPGHKEKP